VTEAELEREEQDDAEVEEIDQQSTSSSDKSG
jgi:hypothetical protein